MRLMTHLLAACRAGAFNGRDYSGLKPRLLLGLPLLDFQSFSMKKDAARSSPRSMAPFIYQSKDQSFHPHILSILKYYFFIGIQFWVQ
jgi:hypothetical protein